ncbi:jg13929 [Pararge aegeria aegeria]|uniref:Jg13929 protein n=1 Tax=Pararge aegeria aegeria TaxID=348720 RepID=A0A8S4S9K4_9NEOP|nr:jg13929 [Pararge aegeria aegeria]
MDQMLPSPYNIPGIGTPLHQPEEDQQILPNALQQQHQQQQAQQQQQQHSLASLSSSPLAGFGAQLMATNSTKLNVTNDYGEYNSRSTDFGSGQSCTYDSYDTTFSRSWNITTITKHSIYSKSQLQT